MAPGAITKNLQKLGRYRLEQLLGFNGSFATYSGRSADGKRAAIVAVQTNHMSGPGHWRAISNEASRLFKDSPPEIAAPLEIGEEMMHYWASYEWLEGGHVGETIRDQGLPEIHQAFEWASKVALSLAALHRRAIIHRILNPASVFLTVDGSARLLHSCWGRMICGVKDGWMNESLSSILPFVSPEIASGQEGDEASDVYSIGANLYFFLTGQPAHWDDDPATLVKMIIRRPAELTDLRGLLIPSAFDVLEEMLQKNPDDRPVNLPALSDRLRAVAREINGETRARTVQDSLAAALMEPDQPVGMPPPELDHPYAAKPLADPYASSEYVAPPDPDPVEPPPVAETAYQIHHGAGYVPVDPDPPFVVPSVKDLPRPGPHYQDEWQEADLHAFTDQAPQPADPHESTLHLPYDPARLGGDIGQQDYEAEGARFNVGEQGFYAAFSQPTGPAPATSAYGAQENPGLVTVLDEQVESVAERRKRLALMVGSGIVIFLALAFLGINFVVKMLSPKPPEQPKKPVQSIAHVQQSIQEQQADVVMYSATNATLRTVAAISKGFQNQTGRWPAAFSELNEFGATASMERDAWDRPIDFREAFIISAGKDGKWDNDDDVWYDLERSQLGGHEPKVQIDASSPLLAGQGDRLNKILQTTSENNRAIYEDAAEENLRRQLPNAANRPRNYDPWASSSEVDPSEVEE